jgi:hypothetical protein
MEMVNNNVKDEDENGITGLKELENMVKEE